METLADIDFEYQAEQAAQEEATRLKPMETYRQDIIDRLNGLQSAGAALPWQITHDVVRLRHSEVSVWAGVNGHGKSQILGMVAAWLLPQDCRVCIASLEMPVAASAVRMLRQTSGVRNPSQVFIDRIADWSFGRLWFYDELGLVDRRRLLGLIHYSARELGCTHIVIDSLMKCGIAGDDYNAQKNFVDWLCQSAKRYRIHIHLVHHMRKGEREGKAPDKFDVRGASEITDLVDNLFIVHRNKDKEKYLANPSLTDEEREAKKSDPDATLTVAKQRHGEFEGQICLWFDPDSQQYVKSPNKGPLPWPSAEDRWLGSWT